MPLRNPLRPGIARSLRVVLPPPLDREISIAPLSIQQTDRCLELDPAADAPPETERERVARLCRQAEILLGPEHAHLTGVLTIEQVADIVTGIWLHSKNIDPTDTLAVQQHLREQRNLARTAEEARALLDTLVLNLAASMDKMPAEVEAMPIATAVALSETRQEKATEDAKWDAALHGIKLT